MDNTASMFGMVNRKRRNAVLAIAPAATLAFACIFRGAENPGSSALFSLFILLIVVVTAVFLRRRQVTWECLLLIALLVVGGALGWTGNWYQARYEYAELWAAVALFGLGQMLGARRRTFELARAALIIAGGLYAGVFLVGALLTKFSDPNLFWNDGRLAATFVSPNVLATLLNIILFLSASRIMPIAGDLAGRRVQFIHVVHEIVRRRFVSTLTATCVYGALLMTASRAGIAFGTGGLVIYTICVLSRDKSSDDPKFSWRVPLSIGLLSVLCLYLALDQQGGMFLVERSGQIAQDTQGRLQLFSHYWGLWQEQWLLGHGLGGFNSANDEIVTRENAPLLISIGAAHNVVLQWLIQGGVVGLVMILVGWGAIHYRILKDVLSAPRGAWTFSFGVLLLSGVVVLHGMVDYGLEIPGVMWNYVFILGLANGNTIKDWMPEQGSDTKTEQN